MVSWMSWKLGIMLGGGSWPACRQKEQDFQQRHARIFQCLSSPSRASSQASCLLQSAFAGKASPAHCKLNSDCLEDGGLRASQACLQQLKA